MNVKQDSENPFDKMLCHCGWTGFRMRAAKVQKGKETKEACPMCLNDALQLEHVPASI